MFSSCVVNGNTLYYALVMPAAIILIINIVLFLMDIIGVLETKFKSKLNRSQSKRRSFRYVVFGVIVLIGLPWIFAFFAVKKATMVFQWLFCITSSVQGFFIFIYFVVLNSEIRKIISQMQCFKKPTTKKSRVEMGNLETKEAVALVGEST